MPFVKRNADGKIIAAFTVAETPGMELVDNTDSQLIDFMYDGDREAATKKDMLESDLGLARVLEDLVDLLIEKGTFRFTDLPQAAQQKLLSRRGLRKEFAYVETLFSAEDESFSNDYDDKDGYL